MAEDTETRPASAGAEEREEEEIAADDGSSAARGAQAISAHPLEHAWTFWLHNPPGKSRWTSGRTIHPIHTFSTVEDFWSLYNNNIHHPSKLNVGADFHCFKNKIEPKWEDPICANGGKWTIRCGKGKSQTLWLHTLLALIDEKFNFGDEICGSVVSVRQKYDRVAIWTKNAANDAAQISIGKQWKEFVDYKDSIGFIVHEDAKNRPKNHAKNRYTV